MSCYFLVLFLKLFIQSVAQEAAHLISYRKFIHQKDMSEYCRRNVMPSVFLGRQVVDANSKILHFSRLEVPYSCLINVRTETGSNLIVVIQVNNDWKKACSKGDSQLIIHEMGETFGGYWEQIPDRIMKGGLYREDSSYTLKFTKIASPTVTMISTTTTQTITVKEEIKNSEKDSLEAEYFTVELPLLNVSAEILPGKLPPEFSFTAQNGFDINYDMTSWTGNTYDSLMVPIVEIALKERKSDRRVGENIDIDVANFNSELQVNFNELVTPDSRLTLPLFTTPNHKRKLYKYQPSVNKRLDFKKNYNLFAAKRTSFTKLLLKSQKPQLTAVSKNPYLKKLYDVTQKTVHEIIDDEQDINSWDAVRDILKNLSSNKNVQVEPHKELANILRGISNITFNESVYLAPGLLTMMTSSPKQAIITQRAKTSSIKDQGFSHKRTKFKVSNDTRKRFSASMDSIKSYNKSNVLNNNYTVIYNNETDVPLLPLIYDVDSIILNVTNQNKGVIEDKLSNTTSEANVTMKTNKSETITISLVDHESWENIVKAAPVMAVKLNQTKITTRSNKAHELTGAVNDFGQGITRQKRSIHVIDTDVAKPKQVPIKKQLSSTSTSSKFNMMEYQQHIELQNEINDHVAMRFSESYIGPPLLNFCALNMTATRHVHLFNSSRLVFAITNFTLKYMTLVVTPANILMDSEERCETANLECQISGARVCIDSLCACDGVPNCGSFDIYDEDRLQCGATVGNGQNVCLAAITFLALLLTVVYTIYYWLKRCVPKVSGAFFIYTDAAENVLYLDTVMRSPYDVGFRKNINRQALINLEYANIYVKRNIWQRFINRCRILLQRRNDQKAPEDVEMDEIMIKSHEHSDKLSTFAKIEIDRMAPTDPFQPQLVEVAVQTNSCFEMKRFVTNYYNEPLKDSLESILENNGVQRSSNSLELIDYDLNSNQALDEINILKFFKSERAGRSISAQLNPENAKSIAISELSNMQINKCKPENQCNNNYDKTSDNNKSIQSDKMKTVNNEECSDESVVKKQLKFHEEVTVIPSIVSDEELEENFVDASNNKRRSIIFGANKVFHIQSVLNDQNDVNKGDEPSGSAVRELKSYFNWGSKEKIRKRTKK